MCKHCGRCDKEEVAIDFQSLRLMARWLWCWILYLVPNTRCKLYIPCDQHTPKLREALSSITRRSFLVIKMSSPWLNLSETLEWHLKNAAGLCCSKYQLSYSQMLAVRLVTTIQSLFLTLMRVLVLLRKKYVCFSNFSNVNVYFMN